MQWFIDMQGKDSIARWDHVLASAGNPARETAMNKIAVIGWGSLLWDLDDLAPHVTGQWQVACGPVLPFEFVRVSPKRKQALVVVIDAEHGAHCATSHIESTRSTLEHAIDDLARRERTTSEFIGHLNRKGDMAQTRHEYARDAVSAWLHTSDYDAAVWTDLNRNFEDVLGRPFSISGAIDYLRTLQGDALIEARRYIESAPANVETPLRAALRQEAWWQAVTY